MSGHDAEIDGIFVFDLSSYKLHELKSEVVNHLSHEATDGPQLQRRFYNDILSLRVQRKRKAEGIHHVASVLISVSVVLEPVMRTH